MDFNHLLTRENDEGSDLVHELILLVEHHSWNIEDVIVPWMEVEENLGRFQDYFCTRLMSMTLETM